MQFTLRTVLHPTDCSSGAAHLALPVGVQSESPSPPHSGAHLALPGGVLAECVEEGAGVKEAGQVQRAYRGGGRRDELRADEIRHPALAIATAYLRRLCHPTSLLPSPEVSSDPALQADHHCSTAAARATTARQ